MKPLDEVLREQLQAAIIENEKLKKQNQALKEIIINIINKVLEK